MDSNSLLVEAKLYIDDKGKPWLYSEHLTPRNGNKVVTEKYGVWDFKDEGNGCAPLPFWANKNTCKKVLATPDQIGYIWMKDLPPHDHTYRLSDGRVVEQIHPDHLKEMKDVCWVEMNQLHSNEACAKDCDDEFVELILVDEKCIIHLNLQQ